MALVQVKAKCLQLALERALATDKFKWGVGLWWSRLSMLLLYTFPSVELIGGFVHFLKQNVEPVKSDPR